MTDKNVTVIEFGRDGNDWFVKVQNRYRYDARIQQYVRIPQGKGI